MTSPTPPFLARSAASSKRKWRLRLLLVIAAVALLPTLFLAVRTISKPPVMQLALSPKASDAPASSPAAALTILVGSGHQLYYYFGATTPAAADLHAITPVQPIQQVINMWQQRSKSTIFIKLGEQTNYQALTDLLDELNRSGQRRYAVVAATAADRQLLLANGKQ